MSLATKHPDETMIHMDPPPRSLITSSNTKIHILIDAPRWTVCGSRSRFDTLSQLNSAERYCVGTFAPRLMSL